MKYMQWLRSRPFQITAPVLVDMPHYAPLVAQLAAFALGDFARGRAQAAVAIRGTRSEREAIRSLHRHFVAHATKSRIPPSITTTNSIQRVLTIAERWHPETRLVVALYVLANVERDDLDAWVEINTGAERVATCIEQIVRELDLLTTDTHKVACAPFIPMLLDAPHPEQGRQVRMHALGCSVCRERIAALATAAGLLRTAIEQRFPRGNFAMDEQHASIPPIASRWTNTSRIGVLVVLIIAVCFALTGRAAPRVERTAPLLRPQIVLERALARFDTPRLDGILHERYQMYTGRPLEIERYTDSQRLQVRLNVSDIEQRQPILDLVVAENRLRYTLWVDGTAITTTVENPHVSELVPLLRMLPEGGALRSFPAMHMGMDVELLSAALRNGATFLGTTTTLGNPAYIMSYIDAESQQQIVLTIDAATYALLRATNIGTGARATTQVLWLAQTVEQIPEAPPRTFDTGVGTYQHNLPNPRHLAYGAFSNVHLDDVSSYYGFMPVPEAIPIGTSLAYLREDSQAGVLQLYEGPRITVGLITAPPPLPSISLKKLAFHTGDTYWDILRDDEDVTHVEFIRNTDPTHRSHLYVWHATMSKAERRIYVETVVKSIQWIEQGSGGTLGQRFEEPSVAASR